MKLAKLFIIFIIFSKCLTSCTHEDLDDLTITNQIEDTYSTGDDGIPPVEPG